MTGRQLFKIIDKFHMVLPIGAILYEIGRMTCNCLKWGGVAMKYAYYKFKFETCGTNVSVHPDVRILSPSKIRCGSNVSIHPLCYIDAEGGLQIGNNVSIAHNTTIMTSNHTWTNPDVPIKYNPKSMASVIICDDVWIGCGVRIMAGVEIGKRVVIAAGAVVTKNCIEPGVYGGVPARLLKNI